MSRIPAIVVAGPVTTGVRRDLTTRFQPGQSGNPCGRPKGSRHKLSETFIVALNADFEEHGESVIRQVRTEMPAAYLKVIASILPRDLNVRADPLADIADDDLAALLMWLRQCRTTGEG